MKDHVALIVKKDGKILFIRRAAAKKILPNTRAFPSGTKENKETIEETAQREAKEELGIEIKVEKILGIKELLEFDTRLHFTVCQIMSDEPKIMDQNEIAEIEYLTFGEFFQKYDDSQIGHGLIYLRKHPELWRSV